MARIIEDQTNIWARQQGVEAQRTDLWVVDFREALAGIKATSSLAQKAGTEFPGSQTLMALSDILPTNTLATYYAKSISLPELRVRADSIRRDSRPYNMPAWDDPLDPIRISFFLDCFKAGVATSPFQSDVYNFLDFWRSLVRAGRGAMSSEYSLRLNDDYRIDYAFGVTLKLLRPGTPEVIQGQATSPATARSPFDVNLADSISKAGKPQQPLVYAPTQPTPVAWAMVQNDLQEALVLKLINCWISSFKVSDLSYDQGRIAQIDATFYADNVQQPTISAG